MSVCTRKGTIVADNQKRIPALFYQSESGKQPVRDWLMKLEVADRKTIGIDIKTVEFGWPIGMPTCRAMGKGLYEVRSSLTGGRIARVLFFIHNGQMVLLHGFIKKSQKTPKQELDLALNRKSKVEASS
ncbi:MAG: type II toxin-antitoxin system RelE/ParE family toxin [Cyanobacteria bacterium J06581_3]